MKRSTAVQVTKFPLKQLNERQARNLAEAKQIARVADDFHRVKTTVEQLSEAVMTRDNQVDDYNPRAGNVILVNSLVQTGGSWVFDGRTDSAYREGGNIQRLTAEVKYQPKSRNLPAWPGRPEGKLQKAHIEVEAGQKQFEPGTYDYSKSKDGESWGFTSGDGKRTEYRLSNGVLAVVND
jgi:hypothetical protein